MTFFESFKAKGDDIKDTVREDLPAILGHEDIGKLNIVEPKEGEDPLGSSSMVGQEQEPTAEELIAAHDKERKTKGKPEQQA